MCGILGIVHYGNSEIDYGLAGDIRNLTRRLLVEAQARGSHASGICVLSNDVASMFKLNVPATVLINNDGYNKVIRHISQGRRFRAMIGHTRFETKGSRIYNVNNHPIKANKVIGVHNGVIANDDTLFDKYAGRIERAGRVDSEIIFRLIDYHTSKGKSIVGAVIAAHEEMFGGYACAFIHRDWPDYLTIFTDSPPVPIFIFDKAKTMVFASTQPIIRSAMCIDSVIGNPRDADDLITVSHGGARINLNNGKIYEFALSQSYARPIGYQRHYMGYAEY